MPNESQTRPVERPMGNAILRGFRLRCPRCGQGPLMQGYLKVRDHCPACGLDLSPQRADDGPAYLTILLVAHILAPTLMWVFVVYRPNPAVMATAFGIGCVVLSLLLLPRIKGAVVGIQWAKAMHGFGA